MHENIARKARGVAYVKTHSMLVDSAGTPMITRAVTAGGIYIVRNPLDVVVSYSHHLNRDGQLIEGDRGRHRQSDRRGLVFQSPGPGKGRRVCRKG